MNISFYIILFLFLITNYSFSQSEIGVINDPDGYTNIRSGENISYSIIDVIHENEKFLLYKSNNSDWWKVEKSSGIIGYVHKSRIQTTGDQGYLIDEHIYSIKQYDIKFKDYKFEKFDVEIISLNTKKNKSNHDEERIYCRCWLNVKKKDSLLTKLYYNNIEPFGSCAGIFLPEVQPHNDYFIVSKFGDYNGEIIIIDKNGKLKKNWGGMFFITKDNKYLITNIDADISGITVFSFEKDVFIFSDEINFYIGNWYEINGLYYARTNKNVEKEDLVYRFDFNLKKFDKVNIDINNLSEVNRIKYYNNVYKLNDCVCR